jgi:hypothetical protein
MEFWKSESIFYLGRYPGAKHSYLREPSFRLPYSRNQPQYPRLNA